MPGQEAWDWTTDRKLVADLTRLRSQYHEVHEFVASPDGERIAVPVVKDAETCAVCVNEELWDGECERAWHLKFAPDGRLTALVRVDDAWSVSVEGERWGEEYEFVWDTQFSRDGSAIAVQVKQEVDYSVAVNGQTWENGFPACRGFAVSEDGT